jgi:hypothetical protein
VVRSATRHRGHLLTLVGHRPGQLSGQLSDLAPGGGGRLGTGRAVGPGPAGASPPKSTASGNSSNASAEIRVPLANASMAPVTRVGAYQKEPSVPPSTSVLEASNPNTTASHMARS